MNLLGRRTTPFHLGFVLGETILMGLGTVLAVYFRLGTVAELFTFRYSWYRLILVPVVLQTAFYYSELYDFRHTRSAVWTIVRTAQGLAVGSLGLAVIYYFSPSLFLGRGVLMLSYFFILGLIVFWRGVFNWASHQRLFATRLVFLGCGSMADCILEEMVGRSDHVYQVACLVDLWNENGGGNGDNCGVADGIDLMPSWATLLRADLRTDATELAGLVRFVQADMVVVAMDERRGVMPLDELLRCRMAGIPIVSGEDFYETVSGRILSNRIRKSWLVFSPGFQTGPLRRFSKRTVDVTVSLLALMLSSPLALLTALAVKLESRGPVIYKQERVGQFGKPFTIYKFRSMVAAAEEGSGPVWAQENDPRVTRVGRVIRTIRFDEIPQLWNVLKGEMSFVGPRPERPHFVEQLAAGLPFYNERHNMKPGITGWAQISYPYGSSQAAALEKLNYDLYYIKHSSFTLDLLILIRTVKIILFGRGAR